jgi:hypothetical protein
VPFLWASQLDVRALGRIADHLGRKL